MITVKKAIEVALEKGDTKYRIAKNLGIAPITVDKYLQQDIKTMRSDAAEKMAFLYGIKIDPLFINGRKEPNYGKENPGQTHVN